MASIRNHRVSILATDYLNMIKNMDDAAEFVREDASGIFKAATKNWSQNQLIELFGLTRVVIWSVPIEARYYWQAIYDYGYTFSRPDLEKLAIKYFKAKTPLPKEIESYIKQYTMDSFDTNYYRVKFCEIILSELERAVSEDFDDVLFWEDEIEESIGSDWKTLPKSIRDRVQAILDKVKSAKVKDVIAHKILKKLSVEDLRSLLERKIAAPKTSTTTRLRIS